MQINKFQNTNSPSFNAMLRIKRPVNVTRLADGKQIVWRAEEALINPEKIESILPKTEEEIIINRINNYRETTRKIFIYTKNLCYEILAKVKENTLENLYAACEKARSLGADAKAVEFID